MLITAYENGPFVLKGQARYRGDDRTIRESAGRRITANGMASE